MWHPVSFKGRPDFIAWREAGDGKRVILAYNNALCNPFYVVSWIN
jgi:hypothetical protein